jgi:hypothetical protein
VRLILRWLLWFLYWLGRRTTAAPGFVTQLTARLLPMNVQLVWKDPTVRDDDTPLAAEEIARLEVSMRVGGAPDFTLLTVVAAGVQTFTQTDLPPGDYEFKVVAVDRQVPPKSGAAVTVLVNIPVPLGAPGAVTDLVATVI